MKSILVIASTALLVGCGTCPKVEQRIVTQTEYIIRIPPAESLSLPPAVETPDYKQSSQKDVAKYINNLEGQIVALQNKLIEIAKFFDDEKAKLAEKNKTSPK